MRCLCHVPAVTTLAVRSSKDPSLLLEGDRAAVRWPFAVERAPRHLQDGNLADSSGRGVTVSKGGLSVGVSVASSLLTPSCYLVRTASMHDGTGTERGFSGREGMKEEGAPSVRLGLCAREECPG